MQRTVLVMCCMISCFLIALGLFYHPRREFQSDLPLKSNETIKLTKIEYDCFLINLPHRDDRYELFQTLYDRSDLRMSSMYKIRAVDGSNLEYRHKFLSREAIAEIEDQQLTGLRANHYELTKGAIGCYLSHVFTWENIVKYSHKEYALVCEDDCRLPPNIGQTIQECVSHMPDNWDILLCGGLRLDDQADILTEDKFVKTNVFVLLHCYVISKDAIYKILKTKRLFPMYQQIDFFLSELASENILNVYNLPESKLVPQGNFTTDIQIPLNE